jgi:UDP:flavonoid glycosyltransferase YjiC (YdhE family)
VRILFASLGASGHVLPLLALAEPLEAAGHELAFAVPSIGVATVEQAGCTALPLSPIEWFTEAAQRLGIDYDAMPNEQRSLFQVRVAATGLHQQRWVQDLLNLARDGSPDLIVWGDGTYAGPVAAERMGLPHACVQVLARGLGPFLPAWSLHDVIAECLDAMRIAIGLEADPELSRLYKCLVLSPFPPSLQSSAGRAVPTRVAVQPARPTMPPEPGLPTWLADLPPRDKRPRVYVTLGTVPAPMGSGSLLRAVVAGLANAEVEVIITTGSIEPADLGVLPSNVHVERYIPQAWLLPECDVILFHGGSGTTQGAVDNGLPMVVIPGRADQPDNADGLAAAGAALVLAPEQVSPANVRNAVERVFREPTFRSSARRLQSELHALPPIEHVVALLESLVPRPGA